MAVKAWWRKPEVASHMASIHHRKQKGESSCQAHGLSLKLQLIRAQHVQGGSSFCSCARLEASSSIHTEVCFHGESRLCQGDSEEEPSHIHSTYSPAHSRTEPPVT